VPTRGTARASGYGLSRARSRKLRAPARALLRATNVNSTEDDMTRASIVAYGLFAVSAFAMTAGCSRNNIEAINLANEGDKEKTSNPDDALSKYQQASQLDPDNHRILWRLAQSYKTKSDWPNVAATCSKAEEADKRTSKDKKSHFANYWWMDGFAVKQQALAGQGAWADAKSRLDTCIQLDAKFADCYEDLGEVLYHMDDEQGALQNYTQAITLKPDNTDFYISLGALYYDLALFDQASAVYKAAITDFAQEGDKNLFSLHAGLGNVLEAQGKIADAIAEFTTAKKACGDCNDHKEAFFYLGEAQSSATPIQQDGIAQLRSFYTIACKGSSAKKFDDLCQQASEIATRKYNSPLQ
jgi:tetratricopeptide (TPR) repeat protein